MRSLKNAGAARKGACPRHGSRPCTCGLGHLYRFVEPVILLLLKQRGEAHGYELAGGIAELAMTDAQIETAALYRTLRALEGNGFVISRWDVSGRGPARRLYKLSAAGADHLDEWVAVLDQMSRSMTAFIKRARL
jgi:PadR family transcriptional regulator, regulatory protein PadR